MAVCALLASCRVAYFVLTLIRPVHLHTLLHHKDLKHKRGSAGLRPTRRICTRQTSDDGDDGSLQTQDVAGIVDDVRVKTAVQGGAAAIVLTDVIGLKNS